MKDPELSLSVVVPTRNEAPNLEPLLEELGAALDGLPFEVIFVDDSNDETAALLERMAERHAGSPKVRAIHRALEKRTGLGSAVVEGVGLAVGDVIAVMDADLQHPPRVLRQMLLALEDSEVDLVIASRYVRGGSDRGLSGPMRRVISRSSKFLSQLLFKEARQTSDPLSGFFVCRRSQ